MDTWPGLQLRPSYRCVVFKATGGEGLEVSRYYFCVAYQKLSIQKEFLLLMFHKSLPALFDHKQIQQSLLTICFYQLVLS